jgi:predicted DNA-binding transcriptional regulator AlpA
MEIVIDGEGYISTDEVLKILGIKEYKLQEKIRNKEISPPLKPSPRAFWKRSEIEEYKEKSIKEHK